MRRVLASFLSSAALPALVAFGFGGCATPGPLPKSAGQTPPTVVAANHPSRRVIVLIPQSEESAVGLLHLLEKEPKLRMVLAVSPRFKVFAQDALLRARVQTLQKSGRIELAMQLPNAPLLPLIVNTNSAKDAVPAGTRLPEPPFASPEDVVQIIARAKADFFHTWHALPRGIILPFGAASPELLSLFDRLGFAWMVGAIEAVPVDGSFRAGSFQFWDAAPAAPPTTTRVLVWDERSMKEKRKTALSAWIQELTTTSAVAWLPSDVGAESQPLPADSAWKKRTWATRDWSDWIGSPKKNAAWTALRKTREALETYKNSGQASVQRLDMASEEMYTAESANYLSALDNPLISPAVAEEREHELQAALGTIYKLMSLPPPDDLFASAGTAFSTAPLSVALVSASHVSPDGAETVHVEDPAQDDHGDGRLPDPPGGLSAGSYDLRSFDVSGSTGEVRFVITLGAGNGPSLGGPRNPGPLIDVYIDQNRQPNVGTLPLLPGRHLDASVIDAWEYAITLYQTQAVVYRTTGGASSEEAGRFPLRFSQGRIEWTVPRTLLRGSPRRWGYQVLVMAYDTASSAQPPIPYRAPGLSEKIPPVYDFLDPANQSPWLAEILSGARTEVPFIRPKSQ